MKPRLQPREQLPDIVEPPRAAFLCGWWNGIAVGVLIGFAAALVLRT